MISFSFKVGMRGDSKSNVLNQSIHDAQIRAILEHVTGTPITCAPSSKSLKPTPPGAKRSSMPLRPSPPPGPPPSRAPGGSGGKIQPKTPPRSGGGEGGAPAKAQARFRGRRVGM